MKRLFFSLLVATALSGCVPQAQLITLRGSNVQPGPNGFMFDNDTLTLQYSFSAQRGQMTLSVSNKLTRPLYIDWKRSVLMIDKDQIPYWRDVSDVNLSSGSNSRYSSVTGGTISKADQIGFILPQTRIEKRQFVVVPTGSLYLTGNPTIVEEKPLNPLLKKPVKVNVYNYGADESPLQFRNYLTFSTDKDFKTEFSVDTKFWASDVRILPLDQVTGLPVREYNGTYPTTQTMKKTDRFYVPLPLQ